MLRMSVSSKSTMVATIVALVLTAMSTTSVFFRKFCKHSINPEFQGAVHDPRVQLEN